jgi:tetratricopeptide (TPR) repeat protein
MASALQGLKREQHNPQLFYYLGRARYLAGDRQAAGPARDSFYMAALPAFESAKRLAPMDETYGLELAFTLDSLARYDEAEWLFGEARLLDPKSDAVRRYYEAHLARWKGIDTTRPPDPAAAEPPA